MSTTAAYQTIEITAETTPVIDAGPFIDPATSLAYNLSAGWTNEFRYVDDCGNDIVRTATGDTAGMMRYKLLLTELNAPGLYWARFHGDDGTDGVVSVIIRIKINAVLPDITP